MSALGRCLGFEKQSQGKQLSEWVVREVLFERTFKQETEFKWESKPRETLRVKEWEVHLAGAKGERGRDGESQLLFSCGLSCECFLVLYSSNIVFIEAEVVQDWGSMGRHMSPKPEMVLPPTSQCEVPGPVLPSLSAPSLKLAKVLGTTLNFNMLWNC